MNCNDFEQLLNEAIEQRLPIGGVEPDAHASDCEGCRRLWRSEQFAASAIGEWSGRVPSVDLSEGVFARLAFSADETRETATSPATLRARALPSRESPQSAADRQAAWRGFVVVGIAAAVLLAVLGPFVLRAPSRPQAPELASVPVGPMAEPTSLPAPRPVEDLVLEAGSAWLGLAAEAAAPVRDVSELLPETRLGEVGLFDEEQRPPTHEPPRTESWSQHVSREFQPIGRDVGRAVSFLRDVLPRTEERPL